MYLHEHPHRWRSRGLNHRYTTLSLSLSLRITQSILLKQVSNSYKLLFGLISLRSIALILIYIFCSPQIKDLGYTRGRLPCMRWQPESWIYSYQPKSGWLISKSLKKIHQNQQNGPNIGYQLKLCCQSLLLRISHAGSTPTAPRVCPVTFIYPAGVAAFTGEYSGLIDISYCKINKLAVGNGLA